MFILGVSCYYHDSAAVLLKDGQLVAAAEEERFTRVKHDNNYPRHAIEFCLKQAGITSKDVDYVVFYEKPLVKFERILMTTLGVFPKSYPVFRESTVTGPMVPDSRSPAHLRWCIPRNRARRLWQCGRVDG